MSALGLVATPMGLRVMGVGLLLIVVALALAILRHKRLADTVDRIVSLAGGGHTQEARVLARASGRWARPLVAALGGERPDATSFGGVIDAICAGIALLGILHGAITALLMRTSIKPEAGMATDVAALLASMALLTPLTLIAVAAIIRVGSTARRRVRTAGVEVVIKQASSATTPSSRPRAKDSAK